MKTFDEVKVKVKVQVEVKVQVQVQVQVQAKDEDMPSEDRTRELAVRAAPGALREGERRREEPHGHEYDPPWHTHKG